MKYGTFSCWLWGHKCLTTPNQIEEIHGRLYKRHMVEKVSYCVRCGLSAESK